MKKSWMPAFAGTTKTLQPLFLKLYGFCLLALLITPTLTHADSPRVSVVYQQVSGPYRVIMEEIYKGIAEELGNTPDYFIVPETGTPPDLGAWLSNKDRKLIIALGQRSFQSIYRTHIPLSLVIGAVLAIPSEINQMTPKPVVITYAPAPRVFFSKLRSLAPSIRRVIVVFDPNQEEWLQREAKQAASQAGLELVIYAASNLKTSAPMYKGILENATSVDAIWITHNTQVVDDNVILPEILNVAWSKNLVVFSNRLAHVDKGALFTLYPDNNRLGHRLAEIAEALLKNNYNGEQLQSLEDVRLAVNIRTANHLGLPLSSQQQDFDLVFPKTQR